MAESKLSQEKRIIAIESPYSTTDLVGTRLRGTEEISKPFRFTLQMISDSATIEASELVGSKVSLGVFPYDEVDQRWFNGYVSSFVAGEADTEVDGYREYEIEVVPWFWLLKLTRNSRIFQEKTAPQILAQVFDDQGFTDYEDRLRGVYSTLEYCVQYNESDFDFASRLMERFGIYYYFMHEKSKHTMVLGDQVSQYTPADQGKVEFSTRVFAAEEMCVQNWRRRGTLKTGAVVLNAYNFETSATKLETSENTIVNFTAAKDYEYYDAGQNYGKAADGAALAGFGMEREEAQTDIATGRSACVSFSPGYKFSLSKHPDAAENTDYVLTQVLHEADEPFHFSDDERNAATADGEPAPVTGYYNSFTCIPAKTVFRPQLETPRPQITGLQTAVVTGPQGQEVYVDKFGRIKVQFHWDRDGDGDDKSSCWIRVAQNIAGSQFGSIYHPRVGHEVLVDFINGDPDRPLVTGSVYNDRNMPPYALPDNVTQIGLKTKSIDNGTTQTFNELRFEDKTGKEEIYLHAERDFTRVVENNDSLKVGYDVKADGNQDIEIYNNRTTTLENGNDTLTLSTGDRITTLDSGDDVLTVASGDRSVTIDQGDHTVTVSSGSSTIEAGTAIELKVGSNSLKIDSQGVTIKGAIVSVTGDSSLELTATSTKLNGDGNVEIKGGLVKIN